MLLRGEEKESRDDREEMTEGRKKLEGKIKDSEEERAKELTIEGLVGNVTREKGEERKTEGDAEAGRWRDERNSDK